MAYFTDTAGENLSDGDLCYRKSDGKLWKAQADDAATMPCVAIAGATILADATGNFYKYDEITFVSHGYTVGSLLYVSPDTAGLMTDTAPSGSGEQVQVIGQVKDDNTIWFLPNLILIEVA